MKSLHLTGLAKRDQTENPLIMMSKSLVVWMLNHVCHLSINYHAQIDRMLESAAKWNKYSQRNMTNSSVFSSNVCQD